MRKILDIAITGTLLAALAAPGGAQAAKAEGAEPVEQVEPVEQAEPVAEEAALVVPMVKVEIQHKGRVLKSKPQRMDWDEAGAVRLERGDRVHDVTISVTRKDAQGKKLAVTISYERDGELMIEDFAYDTKAKKREVLRTEGAALAVTVTPRKLDAGPSGRKDKIKTPIDTNDPLAGL